MTSALLGSLHVLFTSFHAFGPAVTAGRRAWNGRLEPAPGRARTAWAGLPPPPWGRLPAVFSDWRAGLTS